jgi:hypothetical protein
VGEGRGGGEGEGDEEEEGIQGVTFLVLSSCPSAHRLTIIVKYFRNYI